MKLSHYLVASETNDYKPWIITPTALAVFCLVVWSLRFMIPGSITLAQGSIDAHDLMNRINQQRSQRFLTTLNTNTKLISAATAKSKDMIARSYFAHVDPDGQYVWPRIESAGYTPYLTLGENLAMDFTDAAGVVTAWMNSPTHRANIVNEKFADQGLASISGTYEPNHETVMIVSLFGTLYKNTSPAPAPSPKPAPAPAPQSTPSPKPAPAPAPTPVQKPVVQNPPSTTSNLKISSDIKVTSTNLSGKTMVDVDVVIAGLPTLVTANLNGQSITLVDGRVKGQFIGRFTFDSTTDLRNKTLHIEARDKNGIKAILDYKVNIAPQIIETDPIVGNANSSIPVSGEAKIFYILRIIFGIFATVYMGFLVLDAIIIHRFNIKRAGIRPSSHLLIFALIAAVSLFTSWN